MSEEPMGAQRFRVLNPITNFKSIFPKEAD